MALIRKFKDTVVARAERDLTFREGLLTVEQAAMGKSVLERSYDHKSDTVCQLNSELSPKLSCVDSIQTNSLL